MKKSPPLPPGRGAGPSSFFIHHSSFCIHFLYGSSSFINLQFYFSQPLLPSAIFNHPSVRWLVVCNISKKEYYGGLRSNIPGHKTGASPMKTPLFQFLPFFVIDTQRSQTCRRPGIIPAAKVRPYLPLARKGQEQVAVRWCNLCEYDRQNNQNRTGSEQNPHALLYGGSFGQSPDPSRQDNAS